MTFKLPEPFFVPGCFGLIKEGAFTADQVRAAYEQGLEDAAKVCENEAESHQVFHNAQAALACDCVADLIRAQKDGLHGGGTA